MEKTTEQKIYEQNAYADSLLKVTTKIEQTTIKTVEVKLDLDAIIEKLKSSIKSKEKRKEEKKRNHAIARRDRKVPKYLLDEKAALEKNIAALQAKLAHVNARLECPFDEKEFDARHVAELCAIDASIELDEAQLAKYSLRVKLRDVQRDLKRMERAAVGK